MSKQQSASKKAAYQLNSRGEFIIENYNFSKPFANFFPGIAGTYGIPMWVFYVNRGQAIASMGTKDKDHSIMEFLPANKAWQRVTLQGFRTFIKIADGKKETFYEPFHNGFSSLDFSLSNQMRISSYGLKLAETNRSLSLNTEIEFFNIPQDSYAALARVVTITNTARRPRRLRLLDGLPQIIPYGTANLFLKKLSRTIEAWMTVRNLKNDVPFYKLDVDPTDRPEIIHVREGNFYLSFTTLKNKTRIIRPIVDPEPVFGPVVDFSCPYHFLHAKKFSRPSQEITESKTPSALSPLEAELGAGESLKLFCLIGNMRSLEMLNASIERIASEKYFLEKQRQNQALIENLQQNINTESSCRPFDLYAKQTYLDNLLRGGYPVTFKAGRHNSVFYLYSRKHGDLERDYNKFQIQPSYFSQGNGNYRDINQNRRCDGWFNPDIDDENLVYFLSLLQTDGFNPLVVKGISYSLKDPAAFKPVLLTLTSSPEQAEQLLGCLQKTFTPGEVVLCIEENRINLSVSYDDFIAILLTHSFKIQEAEHGEGFWTDHWTYNLDLLDNYEGLFPEHLRSILFEKRVFTYYDSVEVVRPRAEKYVLYDGRPRQLHSVAADNAKKEMIRKRQVQPYVTRTEYGNGQPYHTTLINKLLCLFANKLASLDPFGVGIEMEANKPNWYDALNGLPGLFGSSLCETLELKRLALFIKGAFGKTGVEKISLTEEVLDFLREMEKLLQEWAGASPQARDFCFWDKSYAIKEAYRGKTRMGVSGKETDIARADLLRIIDAGIEKIDAGIQKARDKKSDLYYSYFINEVSDYELINEKHIRPRAFTQKALPLFLEGQVHALRLIRDVRRAADLYEATRKSPLFDKTLKMYKVTASLKSMPEEIGRCRVFTPGWLEHESIWLHMEYKYLLEILKSGLHEEFYREFKNLLIPFQKPQRYGRSILENSSFLVSSAFPDKNLHGNGFVARLSGSTAEFIEIWLRINAGEKPFFLDSEGKLNLRFSPVLAGWLFRKDHTYSFTFLSSVRVVYHNPSRKDTFGKGCVRPHKIVLTSEPSKTVTLESGTIPAPYAQQVRDRRISRIDVFLK
ncbi:MAG: cellobiose phosphorylase [Candidatus Omnitrophica bacterium]|nr:cellobiose phosphorylase [Candidatus Omnitrophota bacterium]